MTFFLAVPLVSPRLLRRFFCAAFLSATFVVSCANADSAWQVRVWASAGLSDRYIAGVVQGADGFLWVATTKRLARFDGSRFEEFQLPDVAPGAESRRIRALRAARDGGLWIAAEGGQIIYLSPNGSHVYREGVPEGVAEGLLEDGEGALWITYKTGEVCRLKEGRVQQVSPAAAPDELVAALAVDHAGLPWFIQNLQIGLYRDGQFRSLEQRINSSARFAAAKAGGIWIATTRGLFSYAEGERLRRLTEAISGLPGPMLEDRRGALWIGTSPDGLYRYTKAGGLERIPTSHPDITCLTEDSDGTIWAGTAGGGLNCIRPRALTIEGDATGLPHEAIQSLCEDAQGMLWAATQSGAIVRREGDAWRPEPALAQIGATCVAADPRGGIWIGTRKRAFHRWHEGRLETWEQGHGLESHTVTMFVAASDGTLFLAGDGPVAIQRIRDGKLQNLTLPPKMERVQSMAEDSSGQIWMGTDRGRLFRVEGDAVVPVPLQGSPRSAIRGLQALPDGTLLLGYRTAGLGWFKNGRFALIRQKQGLFSEALCHLETDDRGWLWCGGDDGIFRVRLQEIADVAEGRGTLVRSIHYGPEQGMPNVQLTTKSWGSALRSRDGRIWIPMGPTLVIANPANARDQWPSPQVRMIRVSRDGQLVARDPGLLPSVEKLLPAGAVRLPARAALRIEPIRQKIEFKFTAPTLSTPESAQFRYRLEGYDADWSVPGAQRSASYPRLPPGPYRFLVQARSSDGVWSEDTAAVALIVAPLYWETWWFRLMAVAGFTAATTAVVRRLSHRRLQRKVQVLRQQMALEKERARIARDLHDDAGNRLTRVLLLSKLAFREREHPEKTALHLTQISNAAREANAALDEVVWAVNPHNDTLSELIDRLGSFAQELCQAAGIACTLELPALLKERNVPTDVRHNLFLAAKEAIHNAIQHARATELRFSAQVTEAALVMVVSDNGRGLDPSPARPGADGLRNLRLRMEEIDGRLEIESAAGAGTRLTFTYPWPTK